MTQTINRAPFFAALAVGAVLCCWLIVASASAAESEAAPPAPEAAPSVQAEAPEAEPVAVVRVEPVVSRMAQPEKEPLVKPSQQAEPFEQVPAEAEEEEPELEYLDSFIATAYYLTGTTATGTYTTENRTLAVNPGIIPYGTHVWLYLEDGTLVGDYYAEDTGANMLEHPYVVDIYMGADSYDECVQWGAQRVLIYTEAENS